MKLELKIKTYCLVWNPEIDPTKIDIIEVTFSKSKTWLGKFKKLYILLGYVCPMDKFCDFKMKNEYK